MAVFLFYLVLWLYSFTEFPVTGQSINNNEAEILSRHKRMIIKNHEWTNGIVPYKYESKVGIADKLEIQSAIDYVQRRSCIRFVPWTDKVKEEYNLDHDNFVKFIKRSSCFARVGNKRGKGQDCSCCDRGSCVHELGHVLGLYHTHHSNIAEGWIRINRDEIRKKSLYVYSMEDPRRFIEYNYDITSMMHYHGRMYTTTYRDTLDILVRGLEISGNRFYPIKAINWYHKCGDKRCSWFKKKCYNDGYITSVNYQCDCMCPINLDPKTGCRTVIKQRDKIKWPSGYFGLIAPTTGCPEGKFDTGSLSHWGEGINWHSYVSRNKIVKGLKLKGAHTWTRHSYHFCISKNYSPTGEDWPPGSYCILKKGGYCPHMFTEGFVQYDNKIRSRRQNNTFTGELPDGVYGADVKLEFCCRDDGLPHVPMVLPSDKPFILFKKKHLGASHCQAVYGMAQLEEYFVFDSVNNGIAKFGGYTPQMRIYPGSQYLIYYCYYEPIDFNCGDVIELNDEKPTVEITSPNYPKNYSNNQMCVWLIKAPNDSKLILTFEDMDVNCNDVLAVGTGHIGQYGSKICGTWMRDNYLSIFNTITLSFTSSMTKTSRGFKAKVSVMKPDEMCYNFEDNGETYRGNVNFTELFEECLPWSEMTHCPHHPFKAGDYEDGLEDNYCRNPGDGLRPWCYIEKDGCLRQYCNVCLKGSITDRYPDCKELQKNVKDFCTTDYTAASHCAETCKNKIKPLPKVIPVNKIGCPKPTSVRDADLEVGLNEWYRVGDSVKYKCKESGQILTRTCLTDGTWTSGGYACAVCPSGWSLFRKHCYKFFKMYKLWVDAKKYCEERGGELTTALDPQEQAFIESLRIPLSVTWIGLSDGGHEGIFKWTNGQVATWTNFKKGAPENLYHQEHCVAMLGKDLNGKWDDKYCGHFYKYTFICKIDHKAMFVCSDKLSTCQKRLEESPALCIEHASFALEMCPYTCGLCNKHTTRRCYTPTKPPNVALSSTRRMLYRGRVVRYRCHDGYILQSGNLDRVCRVDGSLSGTPPVCVPIDSTYSLSNQLPIIKRTDSSEKDHVYTGKTPELLITRRGRILEWHIHSSEPGEVALQIYRPPRDIESLNFTLVSSKLLQTQRDRLHVIRLEPSEQTLVEEGDLLGVWFGSKVQSVSVRNCNGNYYKPSNKVYKLKINDKNIFKPGKVLKFSGNPLCRVFSMRVSIGPI